MIRHIYHTWILWVMHGLRICFDWFLACGTPRFVSLQMLCVSDVFCVFPTEKSCWINAFHIGALPQQRELIYCPSHTVDGSEFLFQLIGKLLHHAWYFFVIPGAQGFLPSTIWSYFLRNQHLKWLQIPSKASCWFPTHLIMWHFPYEILEEIVWDTYQTILPIV